MRSKSADSYIDKLPTDNSSKSLIASIEDVSKNLKYSDDEVSEILIFFLQM